MQGLVAIGQWQLQREVGPGAGVFEHRCLRGDEGFWATGQPRCAAGSAEPVRLLPSFSVDTARIEKLIVPLKWASRTTSSALAICAGVPDQMRLRPVPPM